MPTTLPKAVRTAINRNAQRIAITTAYKALKQEFEVRAAELLSDIGNPSAVVQQLDAMDIDYGPRLSRPIP